MAEPSLKAGGTGTGLKPVTGPQGLKLAASPFTSAPDEKAAVVDVYDLVKPGVINNGIKEASNLLDDLGGIAGNLGDMAKGAMSRSEKAAVVDVYDLVKPGVINNGIKEASNLLDDLGGIAGNLGDMAKGAMSSVTDAAKTALDSTKGLQDTLQTARSEEHTS